MLSSLTAASTIETGSPTGDLGVSWRGSEGRSSCAAGPESQNDFDDFGVVGGVKYGTGIESTFGSMKNVGVRAVWRVPAERTPPCRIDFGRSKARCALHSAAAI